MSKWISNHWIPLKSGCFSLVLSYALFSCLSVFQTFTQSESRIYRLSDCQNFRPSTCTTVRLSKCPTVRPHNCKAVSVSVRLTCGGPLTSPEIDVDYTNFLVLLPKSISLLFSRLWKPKTMKFILDKINNTYNLVCQSEFPIIKSL